MVVKLEPKDSDAWYDYGYALLNSKKNYEALAAFENAIKNNRSWVEPYYEKAKIYFLLGEIENGVSILNIAFELNPSDKFSFDFNKDWKRVLDFLMKR